MVTGTHYRVGEQSFGSPITLIGPAPELRFLEDDQTDPAGRFRLRVQADAVELQRSLDADFAFGTDANARTGHAFSFSAAAAGASIIRGLADAGVLRIDSNLAAVGGSANIMGVRLELFASGHATTPGRFTVNTSNVDNTAILTRLLVPGNVTATVAQWYNGQVTFTTATAGVATATGTVDIVGVTAGTPPLRVINTANAASSQVLRLEGDRSAPADSDEAYASMLLSDSLGNQDEQVRLTWLATTVLDGATQDGQLRISTLLNNALVEYMRIGGATQRTAIYGAASGPDPDSALHVWQGTAGVVAAQSDSALTVERDNDIAISLLAPNANTKTIFFGEPASQTRGWIRFSGSANATADTFYITANTFEVRFSGTTMAFQQATIITTTAGALVLDPTTQTTTPNEFWFTAPAAIGALAADTVKLGITDIAVGDARFAVQAEVGSPVYIGSDTVRATWATQAVADATVDLGLVSGTTYSLVRITSSLRHKALLDGFSLQTKAIYRLRLQDWESRTGDWGRRGYSPVAEFAFAAEPRFSQIDEEGCPIGINWPNLNTAILAEVQEHEMRFASHQERLEALEEANKVLRTQLISACIIPEA